MRDKPDLAEARWFPYDLDVTARRFGMLRVRDDVLSSTFLDNRIEASLDGLVPISVREVEGLDVGPLRSGWLFHTSFCCSTLLARALHVPPQQVCLKEPLVLRRLGDARFAGSDVSNLVQPTVKLLMRSWQAGGAVVVKPTHAALNIAIDLLEATPSARAVVLTSTLEDFLVSNIKKKPETQSKIPQLAERALRASAFHLRLPHAAFSPPDLLAAAALQWAAQRELVQDMLDKAGVERARRLDQNDLLADVPGITVQMANWLGLPASDEDLERHAVETVRRNAKAPEVEYGPARRAEEGRLVTTMFGSEIRNALRWAETNLLPYMRRTAV